MQKSEIVYGDVEEVPGAQGGGDTVATFQGRVFRIHGYGDSPDDCTLEQYDAAKIERTVENDGGRLSSDRVSYKILELLDKNGR